MLESYIKQLVDFKTKGIGPATGEYVLNKGGETLPEGLEMLPLRTLHSNEASQEVGGAVLWQDNDNLHVLGLFEDSDIFNTATEKNERTWTTGDVLECFMKPHPNQEHYFEVHATPSGVTLELRLPSVEKLGSLPFEDLFFDSGMTVETGLFDSLGLAGWWGHIMLPGTGIGIPDGHFQKATFAVCRYNYNQQWENRTQPEISSTCYFPTGGFHQPQHWCRLG